MCKVSVIMPVWNSEAYLTESIKSVINQTYSDFEFIIFDDGSTDQSLNILKEFSQKDSRIKVVACEHQGYSPLLNLGLSMSTGQYIARMDSDDICLPDRFEKQAAFLDRHSDHVAVGSYILQIDPESSPISYLKLPTDHEEIDRSQILGRGKIVHPASMIRKHALEVINGYRPEFEPGEDFDLFLRLAEIGYLANIPEALLKYRLHSKNVTVSRKEHHQKVKQQALLEAYQRRQLNQKVPQITINQTPDTSAGFRFLWMHTALNSAFYGSARKNAWIGFRSAPFSKASIKNLAFGLCGPATVLVKKIYHMNPLFVLFRERPLALAVGLVGRMLDYCRAGIDRVKSKIPKEAYTLALVNSFLKWHHASIARPAKGFLRIELEENGLKTAVNLRSHSSDMMTFVEVIMAKEYLPIIELIKKKNVDVSLIIDVGANIGISTLLFKAHFPTAAFICIEPDPENVAMLQKNILDNQLGNCEVIQAALWSHDHQLELSRDFRDGLSWSVQVIESMTGTIKGVGISSLIQNCQGQRINLLKIDIEGSEFELFKSKEISELLSKTDFLVAKIHEEFGSFTDIQEVLTANDFSSFKHGNLIVAANLKL